MNGSAKLCNHKYTEKQQMHDVCIMALNFWVKMIKMSQVLNSPKNQNPLP